MSWSYSEGGLGYAEALELLANKLEDRNILERAKLAEMRAARFIQAAILVDGLPACCVEEFDKYQNSADDLTREALKENHEF